MTDKENIAKRERLAKESLFKIYLDIKSQVKNKPMTIDREEYEESINSSSIKQLSDYIIDTIEILVNQKISEARKKFEEEKQKEEGLKKEVTQFELYENLLRREEQSNRRLTKMHFQNRLQKEALEMKVAEYMDMEDEFEEMKTKYKYENGKFLQNDRKDNEILIVRTENTNLKKAISNLETKIKETDTLLQDKDKSIKNLNCKLEELHKILERKERELNRCSNNVNICINNCGEYNHNSNSKCSCICLSSKDKKENDYNTHNSQTNVSHIPTGEFVPQFRQTYSKNKKNNGTLNSSAINLKYYNRNESINETNSLKELSIKYLCHNSKQKSLIPSSISKKKIIADKGFATINNKTNYNQFPGYPIIESSNSKRGEEGNNYRHSMKKEYSCSSFHNRKNIFS